MADTFPRHTAPGRVPPAERVHESQGRHLCRRGWIQKLPRRRRASRAHLATRRDPRERTVRSVEAVDWLAAIRQKRLRWPLVVVRTSLVRIPPCTLTRGWLSPDAPAMERACASVPYRQRLLSRTVHQRPLELARSASLLLAECSAAGDFDRIVCRDHEVELTLRVRSSQLDGIATPGLGSIKGRVGSA